MRSFAAALFLLLPALAAADERGSYVSLDREGTDSVLGATVAAHFFTEKNSPDLALRENLYGRYVDRGGFGAYGQIALAHAFANSDSETAFSNLEVGGLYAARLHGADVVARFGLIVPTADDSLAGLFTNAAALLDRLQDVALAAPHTVWLRPGVAVRFGDRAFFGQLDAGIDIPIKTSNGGATDVLFHGNAGVGTTQGPVALTAEVANYAVDIDKLHFLHSVSASVRYADGPIQPFVAYTATFSLESDVDGTVHTVTGGVQGTL